ncbi:hypothetical protein DFH06DRAFT_1128399 [Mycena polygramma]|nr:hypothetical protein DFH06DRAFT_1152663 [Mycena polygramma]KAJ7609376.1 hypothetical protein DFH06DRAFT_1148492 [Mycena polygramma]KAJ7664053.1 hypothetical protein DFH06DRAFT_1128399 [Mycena polygramma]
MSAPKPDGSQSKPFVLRFHRFPERAADALVLCLENRRRFKLVHDRGQVAVERRNDELKKIREHILKLDLHRATLLRESATRLYHHHLRAKLAHERRLIAAERRDPKVLRALKFIVKYRRDLQTRHNEHQHPVKLTFNRDCVCGFKADKTIHERLEGSHHDTIADDENKCRALVKYVALPNRKL